MKRVLSCAVILSALFTTVGAVPPGFNVQGRLTDSGGVNRNGSYSIRFSIFDGREDNPAAAKLWEATLAGVGVRNGNFQVVLGAQGQPSLEGVFAADSAFLEIRAVSGPDVPAEEPPLRPRMQLVSVPYALRAGVSESTLASAVPSGTVLPYAAETAPPGFLECNGAAVSRTAYAALFNVIGERFGKGDGSSTFNLPDLRGAFIRGWNHGSGRDPDAATRAVLADGGKSGDNVGSYQADEFKSHVHAYGYSRIWGLGAGPYPYGSNDINTGPAGGNETRPKNVYMMYIIKI